jgi:hypothetical protein
MIGLIIGGIIEHFLRITDIIVITKNGPLQDKNELPA